MSADLIVGRELTESIKFEYKIGPGAITECWGSGPRLTSHRPGVGNSVEEARADWFFQHGEEFKP